MSYVTQIKNKNMWDENCVFGFDIHLSKIVQYKKKQFAPSLLTFHIDRVWLL